MKVYLYSETPCHLKINGEYLGVINDNLHLADVECDEPFFELLPISAKYLPVYGSKSCNDIKIFNSFGRRFIYPVFPIKCGYPFKVIGQKQQSAYSILASVTVVLDGSIKFFLDGTISDVKALPFIPKDFEITIYSDLIILSFSAEKSAVFIYSTESKSLVFSGVYDEFFISQNLTVKKRYKTVSRTSIEEEWLLSSAPTLLSRRDIKEKDFFDIHPHLLPLAFFENLSIGANVQGALAPRLYDRISDLSEFLGKIVKVVPYNSDSVFLIKPNAITLAKVEMENRLISNVLEEDCLKP